MAALNSPVEHIRLEATGSAWIAGTNTKVIEVALDHLAHGWSPEEIYFQHYGALSMAQIHAALGYYYDNQLAMDAEIAGQLANVERLRAAAPESPVRIRLREEGRLACPSGS